MLALLVLALAQSQTPVPPSAPTRNGFPGNPTGFRPTVEIPFNRFYDYPELLSWMDKLEAAFPKLMRHEVIGHSVEGRELRVYTLTNPDKGADREKPAMWIDGNVHGNEVQGGEAVLYTAWYLLENYATLPEAAALVDDCTFYLLPSQNPDGRAHWFEEAHDASSSRTGYQPHDEDRDGRLDEDPADDLDGDGQITQMRKHVPGQGNFRLDPDDPRLLLRVPPNDKGLKGDWLMLGEEGLDNDGDGRINEDEKGGYDMNRAWPAMWQPDYVQYGAGPYPLYWPETRSVAVFLLDHPNVAALQSFHNSGGMILRGPGAEAYGEYDSQDLQAFDELGRDGEKMLPFYRYMVIWKDLYSVFGGFTTWAYEDLGILSFTNEMWNSDQYYPDRSKAPAEEGRGGRDKSLHFFDDNLLLGAGYVDWHLFEHPFYGKVEIGGWRKDVGRVPPTFLVEEMVHRNALFCLKHARAMPRVAIEEVAVTPIGDGVLAVDAVFRNQRVIPTRTGRAAQMKIGEPDAFTIAGKDVEVLAGGFRTDRWRPERIELAEREPGRLLRERGIGPRGEVRVRWLVRGKGTKVTLAWQGEKARDVSLEVELK
jgi:Zinc carboxypeptidase